VKAKSAISNPEKRLSGSFPISPETSKKGVMQIIIITLFEKPFSGSGLSWLDLS